MKSKIFQISLLFSLAILFALLSTQAQAINYCGVGANLPYSSYDWTVPSAYLFNYTTNATRIDTACWIQGLAWEDITISYKPFPNACSGSYNAICTEDTENYSTSRTYFNNNLTRRYCVNTDNANWRWITSLGGLAEIRANYTQVCAGGSASIDTACEAPLYFTRTRNGAYNYSSWNATGTTYHVNPDVAAFNPTCYGVINGTVTEINSSPISNVNVTLLLSGPGVEPTYVSTLTNAQGHYNFTSIPATYYRVLFSKTNYNSEVVSNKVNYTNTSVINVNLTSGFCNYDCTTQADPSRCSAACNGIAGCAFNSTDVATALDGAIVNTQKVISLSGSNYTVMTCRGNPVPYVAPSVQSAQISCPVGTTLIVLERIVLYNGEPVKVVVPVCRSE